MLTMARGKEHENTIDTFVASQTGKLSDGIDVQRFCLAIPEGPDAGANWISLSERSTIGSHPANDVVLKDRMVSRFHCEIVLDSSGAVALDLDSRNGTIVDGVRVKEAWLRNGSSLLLGQTKLSFGTLSERTAIPLHPSAKFGRMVGQSTTMRIAFARMSRAANAEGAVLLEGEKGTGKEEAAQSIHDMSPRSHGPLVIVDCSSLPNNLLESELFGQEQGDRPMREGAFVVASGGTLFLDEIDELPAELQPKVLRVLERRTIGAMGSRQQPVDVRIIAATNHKLRSQVNEGRFLSDLYYRLAVLHIELPPLRQRPDDIPLLVRHWIEELDANVESTLRIMAPENLARLQRANWPGNVQELRNVIERTMAFPDLKDTIPGHPLPPGAALDPYYLNPRFSFDEARRLAIADFEKEFLEKLLKHYEGDISQAARAAGLSRTDLHHLLSHHKVRRRAH